VTRHVALVSLSRRELENLLLTEHGALTRILEAVRENTRPDWKVRREVERIVEEAVNRRPFRVAYERAARTELDRARVAKHAAQWTEWRESEA
jgi:hypothetical protein